MFIFLEFNNHGYNQVNDYKLIHIHTRIHIYIYIYIYIYIVNVILQILFRYSNLVLCNYFNTHKKSDTIINHS